MKSKNGTNLINSHQVNPVNFRWYLIAILPGSWAIFGSRWGSYLPREPIFLSDLLILLLILGTLFSKIKIVRKSRFTIYGIYFFLLLLKLLFSDWDNPLTLLRDFMPYFYIAMIPLVTWRIIPSNAAINKKMGRFLEYCIVAHVVWCLFSFYFPNLVMNFPEISYSQKIRVFSIRPDFDAAMVSVFIALVVFKRISVINLSVQKVFVILGTTYILLQENRASFISFSILILISIRYRLGQMDNLAKRISVRIVVLCCVGLSLVGISQLTIGQKFIGTSQLITTDSLSMEGAGTASARLAAWTQVTSYLNSSPKRFFFGVGFGSDYLQESGALRALVNSEAGSRTTPRQPHNYWLNTYARMGIFGLGILGVIFVQGLRMVITILRKPANYEINMLISSLIFIALIPIASLGVVLESPFGAITMTLALGLILVERERATR